MTDVKVEQCDVDRAHETWNATSDGWNDWSSLPQEERDVWAAAFARHRQAAEKAQQERDAGIADRHRQARVEAAKNALARKAKSEARDHESMSIEALHIATAIRSQDHE